MDSPDRLWDRKAPGLENPDSSNAVASGGWIDRLWCSIPQFLLCQTIIAFSSSQASILSVGGHCGHVLYLTSTALPH